MLLLLALTVWFGGVGLGFGGLRLRVWRFSVLACNDQRQGLFQ